MGFFDLEEGFGDGYTATIDKVEFAPNQYGDLQATITNLRDEPFTGKEGQLVTTSTVWVTIGAADQWEPCDGGSDFRHVSGDPKKHARANSAWGELLGRIVELIGIDAAKSRELDGHQAPNLVGLHLEWSREGAGETYPAFTDKRTGEQKPGGKKKGKMMPLALAETNGKTATSEPADLGALGIDDETLQTLRNLAEAYSGGKFASEAINLLGALVAGGQSPEQQKAFIGALGDGSLEAALR